MKGKKWEEKSYINYILLWLIENKVAVLVPFRDLTHQRRSRRLGGNPRIQKGGLKLRIHLTFRVGQRANI